MAVYPGAVKEFVTRVDYVDTILAQHVTICRTSPTR